MLAIKVFFALIISLSFAEKPKNHQSEIKKFVKKIREKNKVVNVQYKSPYLFIDIQHTKKICLTNTYKINEEGEFYAMETLTSCK